MPSAEELRMRKILGGRVRQAMQLSGLNVRQLAGKTGQDPSTMAQMLGGTRRISPPLLYEISRITRVVLSDLAAPADAPMELGAPAPGTCPASAHLDLGGRGLSYRLVCDLDENDDHPAAHLDPDVMPGGLWWLSGTDWGTVKERQFMLSLFAGRPELPAGRVIARVDLPPKTPRAD
jgi:transcriptional regulator with XRE-family HTH domain